MIRYRFEIIKTTIRQSHLWRLEISYCCDAKRRLRPNSIDHDQFYFLVDCFALVGGQELHHIDKSDEVPTNKANYEKPATLTPDRHGPIDQSTGRRKKYSFGGIQMIARITIICLILDIACCADCVCCQLDRSVQMRQVNSSR